MTKNIDVQAGNIENYYAVKIGSIWSGLKNENAAFWWLCIYTFLEYVRPQSIYPVIDVLPWAQIALILAMFYAFVDRDVSWVSNVQNKFLVLLFILILVSGLAAYDPSLSWDAYDIPINWLIIYFLIITIINTEKRFFVYILLILIVSFKMSQHGFRTFIERGGGFADWGASGSPGWFQNSGEFGIQMTIFVPLAITFILALKSYWGSLKKILFYMLPVTGLVSILASSSRGAQIAIIAVGLWYLIRSRLGVKGITGLLLATSLLYYFLPSEQLDRFKTAGDDETSLQRIEYWKIGYEMISKYPVTGVGYANWKGYCRYNYPEGVGVIHKCETLHNTYLEAGVELGIPALSVYIIMVLLIFIQNARTRKIAKERDNKYLFFIAYGIDGGLIGYLVSSFFIATFFYPFFWFQLAMTVALHEIVKSQQRKTMQL